MARAKKNAKQPSAVAVKRGGTRPRKSVVPFQVETPTKSRGKRRATKPTKRSPAKKRPKAAKPKKNNKKQPPAPQQCPLVCNAQTHSFTYPTANMFTTGLQHNTEYTAPPQAAEWSNFGQSSYLY